MAATASHAPTRLGCYLQFYYGAINNYPLDPNGVVGLRARDYTGASAGAYFSAGKTRTTPQVSTQMRTRG